MGIISLDTGGLTLPQAFGKAQAARAADTSGGRRRLLVVEDNEDTSAMLRMWLETEGYEVVTAADGWEAVRLALHDHYDAILMDMSLPTMDGMSAVRLLRGHDELRGVPIIALTAYDSAYPRAEAMEAMCDGYLVKPINLAELEGVLRRALG